MATLPAGSYQPFSISYLDAGGERASMAGYGKILTTGNIVAQTAAWADVLTAADALALGARVTDRYNDESRYAAARPTNGAAREVALQLVWRDDTTGQTGLLNLPTIDISLIEYDPNYGAKDVVLLTTTEVAALVDALEAFPIVNPTAQTNVVHIVGARVIRGGK